MHINFYFQFQCVQCESVVFNSIKLNSQKSNQVIILARFFLQRIMFIKFTSMLPDWANSPQKVEYKQLGSYFFKRSGSILINFMNIILCKRNLARIITWLDFWLLNLIL